MNLSITQAIVIAAMSAAIGSDAAAQTPAPPQLAATAAEVNALIAKAKTDRKPDQAIFVQPIVRLAPFTANLEYRVASVAAAASTHERDAEFFYVIEGSATVVTGGTLRDEKRTNAENLTGSAIEGGASRRIAKGDWIMVPEKTPHWFTQVEGALVMMSIHLPRPAAAATK
jgi:mannose-6-phosphate isomerase-like protein (cupin superfamily)